MGLVYITRACVQSLYEFGEFASVLGGEPLTSPHPRLEVLRRYSKVVFAVAVDGLVEFLVAEVVGEVNGPHSANALVR